MQRFHSLPILLVGALGAPAAAQLPVQTDRFFIAEPRTQSPAVIREYDAQGVLIATHDLAAQLPNGVGSNMSELRVLEVTPSGTVLASTRYHPNGGWFEMDGQGTVTTFYLNAGSSSEARGAQAATGLPGGGIVGAHYDWVVGGSRLKAYDANGNQAWSVLADEALSPAQVGSSIYLGHFTNLPVTSWTLGGSSLGNLGAYRHVFTLKSLPGNKLLIGNLPSDSGPVDWIVRDLASGSETTLDTSAFAQPNRWADVDDAGRTWVLCGTELVAFEPGTTQASHVLQLPGFTDGVGLAVSGAPLLQWTANPATGNEYAEVASTSWQQAQAIAESLGGNLTVIDDAAENQWIVDHMLAQPSWIGATDEASEGTWTTPTGTPISYTNWAPGQPDNANGNEDYLEMWTAASNSPAGLWRDGDGENLASAIVERQRILFRDDFSSGVLDPRKWEVVTQGVPGNNAAVFVQAGECALENKAYACTVPEFDATAIGAYQVTFEFRVTDTYDTFYCLIRSDGVPTGPYGESTNGVGFTGWFEPGGTWAPVVRGSNINMSPWAMTGPGTPLLVGTVYSATIQDLGHRIVMRVEEAGTANWIQFEANVLVDTTAVKRITFHNREEFLGWHTAYIDDVVVEAIALRASYSPFGTGCLDPNGVQPSLSAPPGEAPRIGTTSKLMVENLPLTLTVPVFVIGFSNSHAQSAAGPYPLPIDLGILGWPGCPQLVSVDDIGYTITTTGSVTRDIAIPPLPMLAGRRFYAQSLVLYSGGGVAVTNGITATAGW